jgi:hypothetical protein
VKRVLRVRCDASGCPLDWELADKVKGGRGSAEAELGGEGEKKWKENKKGGAKRRAVTRRGV